MEIIRAEYSGFCFGVKSTVSALEAIIDKYGGTDKRIFTYGPIIHNESVVKEYEEKGVRVCGDPDELPENAVVVVRTHGVGEGEMNRLLERAGEVVDGTCPHVKNIHRQVAGASEQGKTVVIVGDGNHPEVKGIQGWCVNESFVVSSPEDASRLPDGPEYFVVAQTTQNLDVWRRCCEAIRARHPDAVFSGTICRATSDRQEACRELAQKCDAMVVIGSKSSSNTKKLYETSLKFCGSTYFIDNIAFLPLKEIKKYNKIGVTAGASAPERTIKEVITRMSEVITNSIDDAKDMSELMPFIDETFRIPRHGEIVKGTIFQVEDDKVYLNIGSNKEGLIPKEEIALEPGQDIKSQFEVGQEIEAKVLKNDDGEGFILLSRKKIEVSEHWDEITKAHNDNEFIEVKVIREVKGGVIAAYKEVHGFIPMSQLNDRYVEKADEFIGQTMLVRVTKVDTRRGKAVFSHKAYLAEERNKKIKEIWESIHVGDVIEGTVMRFTDYGAFVDIGGIDGLLHISEISWGKLKHPQEALEIGQKIKVKILSMNEEKGKISLGLKQNTPEPWSVIGENYKVGQIVEGKVVQIKEYGAFVELEPGLDGLVHISEIAAKRVSNINDELSTGQIVSAKILEIDETKRRISLSIKETLGAGPAPAEASGTGESAETDEPAADSAETSASGTEASGEQTEGIEAVETAETAENAGA